MTREEAISYFKEHNEILVSTAKDTNVYDYEKQVIEADCMRRIFKANEKAIKALEDKGYEQGYKDGYLKGYEEGVVLG